MRDILEDIFADEKLDPMQSARRGMQPSKRQRFYKLAGLGDGEGGFAILLDGKSVRTPARAVLAAPTRALADTIAQEWNAQQDTINPASMPLTRLANAIIDAVAASPQPVADEIAKYLGSDLLFYRADTPQGLIDKQNEAWDPILAWSRDELGARFVLTQGVSFTAQPDTAVAAARNAIPQDAWRLGAVSVITTLTGSALIALALSARALSRDAAWAAANVDEDWNWSQWGRDEEAVRMRETRHADFNAGVTVLELTR